MTRTGLQSNICIVNILPYSFLSYILPTSWLLYWVTFTKPRSSVDHPQVNWMDSSFWSARETQQIFCEMISQWLKFKWVFIFECHFMSSVWLFCFFVGKWLTKKRSIRRHVPPGRRDATGGLEEGCGYHRGEVQRGSQFATGLGWNIVHHRPIVRP